MLEVAAEDESAIQVAVRVLGPFAVTLDGRVVDSWPRPSARRLCELVLVSPGRRISRDLACEELFPALEPRAAARALSKALSMARGTLAELGEPAAGLLSADLTHIWVSQPAEIDADSHEDAIRAALAVAPGQARDDQLVAALAENGELLADEPYAAWATRPRERLEALRQEARLALARDRSNGSGRSGPDDVVAAWQDCLDHDAACEEAAGALVRACFANGRPELAARAYERCRTALEELGLRISPSLQRVYAVLAPAPVGLPPTAAPAGTGADQALLREELRTVTVLYAEVAAPPGPAGSVGLEALRALVSGSLAVVITQVEALGGIVTSVSGRGLQAMFGAPTAHEDDPERAVRAAFRALSATPSSAEDITAELRIGVETGAALVGPIGGGGRVEYGAVGDVVSAAAALQSAARPGLALIGPATRAVTDHLFTWSGTERVDSGTSAGSMLASYLGGPRARATGRQPGLGGSAPLTGRQAELAGLGRALRDAAEGRGSVVVLTGEPGLGKTRLVQECRKLFLAQVGSVRGRLPLWLEGRGASYASSTPYALYQQLIASWVGVAPDQPAEQLRSALAESLSALMGNTNLLAPLARMMGLPGGPRMSPEEQQRAIFDAVRSLVTRFAAVSPTVIALEDLHWADPTSLRLTGELAALAAGRRLLMLATTRPGPRGQPGASWPRPARAVPQPRPIVLRPLSRSAVEALARSLIGENASPEVLDAVLVSVEGNPLFLEERLSSLFETKVLVREDGAWRLRGTPGSSLPQVLDRLVRSRVDRLSRPAQDAIRAASVLGPEFTQTQLASVRIEAAPLEPIMDELCASDLVHEMPGAGEPTFRFRHALIQEATYLGMLRAERRSLHGRAGRALEAASAGRLEEAAAVLGRHFAAVEDADRAVYYLELAGDHAADTFANDEAVSSLRTALSLVRRPDGARSATANAPARLQEKLANVLWRTGRREEAREVFQAAIPMIDPSDMLLRAHFYTRLGRLNLADYRFDAAAEAFEAAGALLGTDPQQMDDAAVEQWLELMVDGWADLRVLQYEPDEALAALEAARPVLERGAPARTYAFYEHATKQRLIRKRFRADDSDIETMRLSLEAAKLTGEEKDAGYALHFLGWVHWLRGEMAQAQQLLEQALALAERIGEALLRAMSLLELALVAVRRHDSETVRSLLLRTMAAYEAAGTSDVAAAIACQAWLMWQDGRPDEVIRLSGEYEEIGSITLASCSRYRWVYLWPLIGAQLSAGATEKAVAAARQILDPSQQSLPGELTAALRAACEAWNRGEAESAAAALSGALDLAHQLHFV